VSENTFPLFPPEIYTWRSAASYLSVRRRERIRNICEGANARDDCASNTSGICCTTCLVIKFCYASFYGRLFGVESNGFMNLDTCTSRSIDVFMHAHRNVLAFLSILTARNKPLS
jgi:hypothetical protein